MPYSSPERTGTLGESSNLTYNDQQTPRRPFRQFRHDEEVIPSSQSPSQFPISAHPFRSQWAPPSTAFHVASPEPGEIIPDSQLSSPERSIYAEPLGRTVHPNAERGHLYGPLPLQSASSDSEIVPSSQTQLVSPIKDRSLRWEPLSNLGNDAHGDSDEVLPTQEESYAPWVKGLLQKTEKPSFREPPSFQTAGLAEDTREEVAIRWSRRGVDEQSSSQTEAEESAKLYSNGSVAGHERYQHPTPTTLASRRNDTASSSSCPGTPFSQFSFDVTRVLPSQYPVLPEMGSLQPPSESFFDRLAQHMHDDVESD